VSKERDRAMSIWEHVNELIKRMKVVAATFVVSSLVFLAVPVDFSFLENASFYRTPSIVVLEYINQTIKPKEVTLIAGEITAPLELWVMVSFLLGAVVTAPVFAYQLYRFVDPALYPEERRAVYPFVVSFTSLFVVGAIFGFYILVPFMLYGLLPFFRFVSAQPIIFVNDFYSLVFLSVALSGLSFTLPVFFVLLVKFHVMSTGIVRNNRKYFYAALYIITAIITPDGGPLADIALFLPMAILTEVSIMVARRYEKEEEKPEELPMGERCRYCGALLEPGVVFCPSCKRSQV